TAEKLVTRYVKGFPVREWHKPEKARNEALDCRVYALAALKIMQPPLQRLAARLAERAKRGNADEPAKIAKAQPRAPENPPEEHAPKAKQHRPTRPKLPQRRRGGWVRSW